MNQVALDLHSHVPWFVAQPGETDVLFVAAIVILIAGLLMAGNIYMQLHNIPERMAHGASPRQFEMVAVLCLLALFTHNGIFWVAALLIALIRIPDYRTPLSSIADSLTRMELSGGFDRAKVSAPEHNIDEKGVNDA